MISLFISLLLLACTRVSAADGPCTGTESYRISDGRDYRGSVSRSRSGIECQKWTVQYPHRHATPIDVTLGTGNHNHCRNPFPGALTEAGCFTTDLSVRWEACDIGQPCQPGLAPTIASLVVTPDASRQLIPFNVSIRCPTADATILYTLDGTMPTDESHLLPPGESIVITKVGLVTLKAVATKKGYNPSSVIVRQYFGALPRLPSPVINPSGTAGTPSLRPILVTLSSPSGVTGANIYYSLDGSSLLLTAETGILYTGPFWLKKTCTVTATLVKPGQDSSLPVTALFDMQVPQTPNPRIDPDVTIATSPSVYYGGVVFTLTTPNTPFASYSISINGSAPAPLENYLSSFLVPTPADGTRAVEISSPGGSASTSLPFYIRGLTHFVIYSTTTTQSDSDGISFDLDVRPLPRIRFQPPPGSFYSPVMVSAVTDDNLAVVVQINGSQSRGSNFAFTTPNTYLVNAFVKTRYCEGPTFQGTYSLTPIQLDPPRFIPDPNAGDFPTDFSFVGPLLVRFEASLIPDVKYKVSVTSTGSAIPIKAEILGSSSTPLTLPYSMTQTVETLFTVTAFAVPATDANLPFLLPSQTVVKTYRVAAPGTSSTPFFRIPTSLSTPTPNQTNCSREKDLISKTVFLNFAGSAQNSVVEVPFCQPWIVFRLVGLPSRSVASYTRWIVQMLMNSDSSLYKSFNNRQNTAPGVDLPLASDTCVAVPSSVFTTAESQAVSTANAGGEALVSNPPLRCLQRCSAARRNAGSALTHIFVTDEGSKCACYPFDGNPPLLMLTSAQCNSPCPKEDSDNPFTCGGVTFGGTDLISSKYLVLGASSTSALSRVTLFPFAYGWELWDSSTQAAQDTPALTTTTPFDVRVVVANLLEATNGGSVKFITGPQECTSLASEFSFNARDGIVRGVILRSSGQYRMCIRFDEKQSDDQNPLLSSHVYVPVPLVTQHNHYGANFAALFAANALTILSGDDVPVTIVPASGQYLKEVVVTMQTQMGNGLRITIDGNSPFEVDSPKYVFRFSTLGSHQITASGRIVDDTGKSKLVGVPISQFFDIVSSAEQLVESNANLLTQNLTNAVDGYVYILSDSASDVAGSSVQLGIALKDQPMCTSDKLACVFYLISGDEACSNTTYLTLNRTLMYLQSTPQAWKVSPSGEGSNKATSTTPVQVLTTSQWFDFAGQPLSRKPFSVCMGIETRKQTLHRTATRTAFISVPYFFALHPSSAPAYPLSVASTRRNRCAQEQQQMCKVGGRCTTDASAQEANRTVASMSSSSSAAGVNTSVYVCECPLSVAGQDTGTVSAFCVDASSYPESGANAAWKLQIPGKQEWNGTLFAVPDPALTTPPVDVTKLQVKKVQGSWTTLFGLLVIFAGSTAVLVWYKRQPENSKAVDEKPEEKH